MSTPNKTWFVTGASSGLGRAFVEHAAARGHNVVATARTVARLDDLVALAPERVLALTLDVDRPGDAEAAVEAALARFGRIDVLINNAGYTVVGALEEMPDAELRAIMETNFFGAMAVIRAAAPTLRAQRSGAIVNISSLCGQLSLAGLGAYSASKFAIEGASEALAQELAPFGVKLMIVEPGAFRTGLAGAGTRDLPVGDAYRETVGATQTLIRDMDDKQDGDPRKAAEVIERALESDNTPLRLPLGADAVGGVRMHAEAQLADLRAWESVAVTTAITAEASHFAPVRRSHPARLR